MFPNIALLSKMGHSSNICPSANLHPQGYLFVHFVSGGNVQSHSLRGTARKDDGSRTRTEHWKVSIQEGGIRNEGQRQAERKDATKRKDATSVNFRLLSLVDTQNCCPGG